MDFAVNYSPEAEDLVRRGRVRIDRFKCPAWPDLVAAVHERYPVYVHFPLQVGSGIGDATVGGEPADWVKIDRLMAETSTPLVNLHLALDHARGSTGSVEPERTRPGSAGSCAEALVENLIRDVSAVTENFGMDRVAIENDHDFGGRRPRAAILPGVVRSVVEATGCGLLLDLAHARLAALSLGQEAHDYVKALPTDGLRELHVSGVQPLDGRWLARVHQAAEQGLPIEHLFGRPVDHLPMTGPDWELFACAMAQIHSGAWPRPWVVTFEHGGTGPLFSALTDRDVLEEQMPRVYALFSGG
jgi:uncharacterized protein (UPF0276 family)